MEKYTLRCEYLNSRGEWIRYSVIESANYESIMKEMRFVEETMKCKYRLTLRKE